MTHALTRKQLAPAGLLLFSLLTTGCGVYLAPATGGTGQSTAWTIAPGDLRFKGVGQSLHLEPIPATPLPSFASISYSSAYASPLELGGVTCSNPVDPTGGCTWNYAVAASAAQSPLSTTALFLSNPVSDLSRVVPLPNQVIDSLEIQTTYNTFALSATSNATDATATFTPTLQHLSTSSLAAAIAQAGAAGQVATALAPDSPTTAYVYLYSWQSDSGSHYETTVSTVSFDTLAATAATLAQQGYVLTACGGNNSVGFTLVGTRLAGTSKPRTLTALTGTTLSTQALALLAGGTALVAVIDGPASGSTPSQVLRLYEN